MTYDQMGSYYAEHAADSAHNAHYDRPAVFDCLGDVAAVDILDAACGPGFYHDELLARGARVQAFDGSEQMVQLARERSGDQVPIRRADLDQSLPYADESFDIVLCALAIHYASDRYATFGEFFRVLRPGGRCVVSTQHPTADWRRTGGSYFDVVREVDTWRHRGGEHHVHYWREPLTATCSAATDAGFLIAKIVEPRPAATMRERWPDEYEKLSTQPGFLLLDLVKVPGWQPTPSPRE